jgi:hypothetical protein
MKNNERRLEGRFLCADVVHVTWLEDAGIRSLEAVLEDISALGACVQVEEQIPLGIEITLIASNKNEEKALSGIVSYCVYRDYGYFVGIRFRKAPWSTGVFLPEHLIDLQNLVHRCAD